MPDGRRLNESPLRCYLCGADGPGRYVSCSTGATFCVEHPWCDECDIAHLRMPCPEQLGRIYRPQAVPALVAGVLAELDALGIRLPRVPVRLVTTLADQQEGTCITMERFHPRSDWRTRFGLRRRRPGYWRRSRTTEIQIRAGLGPTRFGQVVAHEHTHALLQLRGATPIEPALEEGVCQLVAVVWLTSRGVDPELLRRIWHNPDPVYGGEMRRVVAVARRMGVDVTLQSVLTTGMLP
jgi:Protein DA1